MGRLRLYYSLTKPGVLFGNVITGAAGFLLAAGRQNSYDWALFAALIVGMTLVIAAACVLNNYLDQDIDKLMERTKKRAMAHGDIAGWRAVIFCIVLGSLGFVVLGLWTNWLVVSIGVVGFVTYVWLYGALSKRRSVHGTLVGSISGALPILAGYCAVSDRLDLAAGLLFFSLFCWQFPEFYSIAIYRRKEYKAANIPVISVARGIHPAIRQIFVYTLLFVASSLALTLAGYTGWIYFIIMSLAGLYWIKVALEGLRTPDNKMAEAWARRMFHKSLLMLLLYSVLLCVAARLP